MPARTIERDGVLYDIDRLFGFINKFPVTSLLISEITWILDIELWECGSGFISPNDIVSGRIFDETHLQRIEMCDLSYPILVARMDNGQMDVIDGIHRLCKVVQTGTASSIECCIVDQCVLEKTRLSRDVRGL